MTGISNPHEICINGMETRSNPQFTNQQLKIFWGVACMERKIATSHFVAQHAEVQTPPPKLQQTMPNQNHSHEEVSAASKKTGNDHPTTPSSSLNTLDPNPLFAFLHKHGGSLFQRDGVDKKWQYSLYVEGREGQMLLTYSVGDTPEEAIQSHYLFKENNE